MLQGVCNCLLPFIAELSHQRVSFWVASKDSCVYTTSPYWCDRNPIQTFRDVANRLNCFGLAYLHIIDGKVVITSYLPVGVARRRHHFTGGNQTAPPLIESQQLL